MSEKVQYQEKALFERIADGDEAAFERLFYLYLPKIQPVILNIVKSEAFIEDIVQEIFFDIWLSREKLAAVEMPRNWIFKMVYNRSYGWLEKQLVRERARKEILQQGQLSRVNNVTEEDLSFNEIARLIQQAVHELPPQAQKIYLLSRQQGSSIADIAKQLNISAQSVKNSLYRSTVAIREYLARNGMVIPLFLLFYGLRNIF